MADKTRKNVTLSPEAIQKGKVLAKLESRPSFSNYVEAVINREYDRVCGRAIQIHKDGNLQPA